METAPVESWFVWIIPLATVLAHYVKLQKINFLTSWVWSLRSFAGGFSIGYVFVILLPELVALNEASDQRVWIVTLVGFAIAHVLHKVLFRYEARKQKRHSMSTEEMHLATAGVYSFLLAFTLVHYTSVDIGKARWLALIILVHLVLTEISEFEPQKEHMKILKLPILLMASSVGVALAWFTVLSPVYSTMVFALAAGSLIYTAIREEIPADKDGSPWLFFVGVILMVLLAGSIS